MTCFVSSCPINHVCFPAWTGLKNRPNYLDRYTQLVELHKTSPSESWEGGSEEKWGCFVWSDALVPSHGLELGHVHKLFTATQTCPCCSLPRFDAIYHRSASAGTFVPILQWLIWGPMTNLTSARWGKPSLTTKRKCQRVNFHPCDEKAMWRLFLFSSLCPESHRTQPLLQDCAAMDWHWEMQSGIKAKKYEITNKQKNPKQSGFGKGHWGQKASGSCIIPLVWAGSSMWALDLLTTITKASKEKVHYKAMIL